MRVSRITISARLAALREAIGGVAGVADVHDLRVWSLTSGVNAMSVHTVLADHGLHDEVLVAVQQRVTTDFKIACDSASRMSRMRRL